MRIIAGHLGGRTWQPPKGLPVRPTTDRTREALFNLLSTRMPLEGAHVLDLFSGTGAVSLECISRGAGSLTAVDRHRGCIHALRTVIRDWQIETPVTLIQQDVRKFTKQVQGKFDLIFLDPPYDMPGQAEIVHSLLSQKTLQAEGLLVWEHRSKVATAQVPGFVEVRKYGDSSLSFFEV